MKRSFPPRVPFDTFVAAVDAYVREHVPGAEHRMWRRHHRWETKEASAQVAQVSIVDVEVVFRTEASDEPKRAESYPLTTEGAASAAHAIAGALTLRDNLGNAHE